MTHDSPTNLEKAAARIAELEREVYVPGLRRCAKCGFQLMKRTLDASTGNVWADNQTGDKCPNCAVPMWRVTERQAGNETVNRWEEQAERARKAEERLREVERERDIAQASADGFEAALSDANKEIGATQKRLANMIQVWRFQDAPATLQELSPHGGDEDWLAVLPPSCRGHVPSWMEEGSRFGCSSVSEHPQPGGWLVCIGAHA